MDQVFPTAGRIGEGVQKDAGHGSNGQGREPAQSFRDLQEQVHHRDQRLVEEDTKHTEHDAEHRKQNVAPHRQIMHLDDKEWAGLCQLLVDRRTQD